MGNCWPLPGLIGMFHTSTGNFQCIAPLHMADKA